MSGVSVVEFQLLGFDVRVECQAGCEEAAGLLALCYRELITRSPARTPGSSSRGTLPYRVSRARTLEAETCAPYRIQLPSTETHAADDPGALLFLLEKDLTTRIQRTRPDLLFLHAACLAWKQRAVLLVGDPGSGKSTLTFALLAGGGFGYLSDELTPFDLDERSVHPYPRSLWLKRPPPPPCELPPETRESSRGIHVPCAALGAESVTEPLPLGGIFLLEPGVASREAPSLWPVGAAEAVARLFANILNPRGHPSDGLDAALTVASAAPCFVLRPAGLEATRSLVVEALD